MPPAIIVAAPMIRNEVSAAPVSASSSFASPCWTGCEPAWSVSVLLLPVSTHSAPSRSTVQVPAPPSVDEPPVVDDDVCSPVVEDDEDEDCSPVVDDEDEDDDCSPVVDDEDDCSPVVEDDEEDDDCSPVVEDEDDCSPVVDDEEDDDCSPVVDDEDDCSPVVEDDEDCSPVVEDEDDCSPVVEDDEDCSPVVEDEDDCSPVVDDEDDCSPVVDVDCSPEVEVADDCSPVVEDDEDCSPVVEDDEVCSPAAAAPPEIPPRLVLPVSSPSRASWTPRPASWVWFDSVPNPPTACAAPAAVRDAPAMITALAATRTRRTRVLLVIWLLPPVAHLVMGQRSGPRAAGVCHDWTGPRSHASQESACQYATLPSFR
ncbi:hypothetical protein STANM309S_00283 [Streptomyces tanashiensis]